MTKAKRWDSLQNFINQVNKQLIVSCQALPDEPLYGPEIMSKMAIAAAAGGARAIRANTPRDVSAIKKSVNLPIIGLYKDNIDNYQVYITPTLDHAKQIAEAGADIIAIDATNRTSPAGDLFSYIDAIHVETECLVLADVSTLEEGLQAERAGADMVATTLSGYTPYSNQMKTPDIELVKSLSSQAQAPILAEGRYQTHTQVNLALENGALAVVVGTAITRPKDITKGFVEAINKNKV
jgi:N-acylglucosamine-6-phosphate 2-epimerase